MTLLQGGFSNAMGGPLQISDQSLHISGRRTSEQTRHSHSMALQ